MIRLRTFDSRVSAKGVLIGLAATLVLAPPAAIAAESPIDLALYAALLDAHSRPSDDIVGVRVDYEKIGSAKGWQTLVSQVEDARPSQLDRDARMAFWINAYNILTIDLIVKHYPLESIKDIGSFFSPVWDIDVATIEDRPISLGGIEHEVLRPMGEPRIHAAIVCASTSCPPLARTPFRPDRLDEDLSAAMRTWLASDQKGIRIDRRGRRVRISKIFDWFEDDFEPDGGVLATISRYLDVSDARWLRGEGKTASVSYFRYDWSLNDLER
jgi:hypothetical protein